MMPVRPFMVSPNVRLCHVPSAALIDNPLGDDPIRRIYVYRPAGIPLDKHLPLMVYLCGFGDIAERKVFADPFRVSIPQRLDGLISTGKMAPALVAIPDCMTALGGNQYLDSAGVGRWLTFLSDDLIGWLERHFACGGTGKRGILGCSSGGYGALAAILMRGDVWTAAASHSGDVGFQHMYLPEFPVAHRMLMQHQLDAETFIRWVTSSGQFTPDAVLTINLLAQAATFDPAADASIKLPLMRDGSLDLDRWSRWQTHDPLNILRRFGPKLTRSHAIYLDCGLQDEFNILPGTRQFARAATGRASETTLREYEGDHGNLDRRLAFSFPWLSARLCPSSIL